MSAVSPSLEQFLAAYRTAFEAFDTAAIGDLFAYPCQITSDGEEISVIAIPSRSAWMPQLARLVEAYRALGVRTAEIVEVRGDRLTSRLVQATVRWRLLADQARELYEFEASYTLADFGAGLRITAIAHNETSRLRAELAMLVR